MTIDKQTGNATVLCALCQLKDEFPAHPAAQTIDVYSYFTDRFYGVKDPRAIIPREREHMAPPEEPTEPSIEPPSEEATAIEVVPDTPLVETTPNTSEVSPAAEMPETVPESTPGSQAENAGTTASEPVTVDSPESSGVEDKQEAEDEGEPFADILSESKDKKRYSPNPLPQQTSEEA